MTGETGSTRPHRAPHIMRIGRLSGRKWSGIAAALAILASGAGAPGLAEMNAGRAAPVPAVETDFDAQFAPFTGSETTPSPAQAAAERLEGEAIAAEEAADEEIGGGMASWYGRELSGRRTASGEPFDPGDYTAAHRSLPFGSKVRVTSLATGRSVIVRINDRGPFSANRVIDVSQAAAREIGLLGAGHGRVRLALLK